MKNLKNVWLSVLFTVTVLFVLSPEVTAQNKAISQMWDQEMSFYCPCAGEMLHGIVKFHLVFSSAGIHVNLKGTRLTGETTGKTYNFVRVDNFKTSDDRIVYNIRTIGENGIVTFYQMIGKVIFDAENLEHTYLEVEKIISACL